MKYFGYVSYDGSKYYGFQKLKKQKTVQGELERVLSLIAKDDISVKGSGRTDRGVHAFNQGISFDLNINIKTDKLKKAINNAIDEGIYLKSLKKVDDNFHARFSVKKKVYEYIINIGTYDPIVNDYVYNYNYYLNIKNMKKASKYLLRFNNYKSFVSGLRDNYESYIHKITFKKRGDYIYITFVGKGFYRYMVRNMVGALILVGSGKIKPSDMNVLLEKQENVFNYTTAKASGLYLKNVEY